MNGFRLVSPPRLVLLLGSAAGLLAGMTAGALAGSATTAAPPGVAASQEQLEAAHLPPLLRLPAESLQLTYETFCIGAAVEDDACKVGGAVFVRADRSETFTPVALEPTVSTAGRRLVARIPESLTAADAVEYFAVLETASGPALTLPAGGAAAPHRSFVLPDAIEIELGRHVFGRTHPADARVAYAAWDSTPAGAGLEEGRNLTPIGASAFDVGRGGAVYVLDEVKHRVLRWNRGAKTPARIPVSVSGALADLEVAPDGTLYVLETVGTAGGHPLVRRFDGDGRELEQVEVADRVASQIRLGGGGPVVLQQPSHQWMSMTANGTLAGPSDQRGNARVGRPLATGGEVVVLRGGDELRVALIRSGRAVRSWRLRSETALGEVQLAEPLGDRMIVVVRAFTDTEAEFVVLILDDRGLVQRIPLTAPEWAEAAPLGRFELAGSSLYRLGSSPLGAFVDRFDLEVPR
jgi:hypothetical protein